MGRRYSIATLMLLTAVAALSAASLRAAYSQREGPDHMEMSLTIGAFVGAVYAVTLGFWNRQSWMRPIVYCFGGLVLGAAAGAQMSLHVGWPVVFAAPVVLMATTALVGSNRLRRKSVEQRT